MTRGPSGRRRFWKIGEVAAEVGVPAHVLRYWEAEVPELQPMKTRGAHRMYREEDVALCRQLRRWVRDEGLTLPAARRRLAGGATPVPEADHLRAALRDARARLRGLLDELETEPGEGARGARAVVHPL